MPSTVPLPRRPPDFSTVITGLDNHVVKKNRRPILMNRKTGLRFIGKSPELVSAESEMLLKLQDARRKVGLIAPIHGYIHVRFLFYFPARIFFKKNGDRSMRIADLSNLYELPQDALQKASIISDDCFIDSHDGSRRLVSPTHDYCLSIEIWRI